MDVKVAAGALGFCFAADNNTLTEIYNMKIYYATLLIY